MVQVIVSAVVIIAFTLIFILEGRISKLEDQIQQVNTTNAIAWSRVDQLIIEKNSLNAQVEALARYNNVQDVRLDQHRKELTDHAEMFGDMLDQVEMVEEYLRSLPTYAINVSVSEADIRDIAALVHLEAGSQSYECQKAIASVIFNRMMRYGMTAQQVIYQTNNGRRVFDPAPRVPSTRPSSSCLMAVREVLYDGCTLPRNVVAFRNRHYHNFGTPYTHIDGVYFSAV